MRCGHVPASQLVAHLDRDAFSVAYHACIRNLHDVLPLLLDAAAVSRAVVPLGWPPSECAVCVHRSLLPACVEPPPSALLTATSGLRERVWCGAARVRVRG